LAAHVLQQVGDASTGATVFAGYQRELERMRADGGAFNAWPKSCGQVDILKDGLYTRAPYVRGALFYRALELTIGRTNVEASLRTFYQRHVGQAAGMQDMLDVIREVSSYDPTACAKVWLTDPLSNPLPSTCP
jgi:hypothetical protein